MGINYKQPRIDRFRIHFGGPYAKPVTTLGAAAQRSMGCGTGLSESKGPGSDKLWPDNIH
jgi:hypothetical protein